MKKWMMSFLAIITGFLLFMPNTAFAESGTTSTPNTVISEIDPNGVLDQSAPEVSLEDMEGKIERGGSQIYSLIQTVVIYVSYIGFAVGILWLVIGFGRSGRAGGLILMFFSSVAFFFIGHGPATVAWLGQWFNSL